MKHWQWCCFTNLLKNAFVHNMDGGQHPDCHYSPQCDVLQYRGRHNRWMPGVFLSVFIKEKKKEKEALPV